MEEQGQWVDLGPVDNRPAFTPLGPTRKSRRYYPCFTSREGLFFCDSCRMARQTGQFNVSPREPCSGIVSPCPVGLSFSLPGDAFLISDELLVYVRSLQAAYEVLPCGKGGNGGLRILGSDPMLSKKKGLWGEMPWFWGFEPRGMQRGAVFSCFCAARMLPSPAFPFFFPSLTLLAGILTYITGW